MTNKSLNHTFFNSSSPKKYELSPSASPSEWVIQLQVPEIWLQRQDDDEKLLIHSTSSQYEAFWAEYKNDKVHSWEEFPHVLTENPDVLDAYKSLLPSINPPRVAVSLQNSIGSSKIQTQTQIQIQIPIHHVWLFLFKIPYYRLFPQLDHESDTPQKRSAK